MPVTDRIARIAASRASWSETNCGAINSAAAPSPTPTSAPAVNRFNRIAKLTIDSVV
jgi:hypothetical protein